MSFGYIGDTSTSVKQKVKNKGILTTQESFDLERQGFLGGSLELIQSQTISSNVANLDFDNIKEDIFDIHFLVCKNVSIATDNQQLGLRFKVGGTVDSDNDYQRGVFTIAGDGGVDDSRDSNINSMMITFNQGNAAREKGHAYLYLYNLGNSAKYSFVSMMSTNLNNGGTFKGQYGGFVYDQTATVNGLSFIMTNGSNIAGGTYEIFGLKQ
jgi:hypothetical protein